LQSSPHRIAVSTPIPPIIIQTAKTRELSLKQRAMQANLRLLNPGFDYLFFDDRDVERFVRKEFPQYLRVFEGFRYRIQRYDFFRYLAVFHFGGFYFDLDVILASELSPLLAQGGVFPFEGLTYSRHLRALDMDWEVGNYAFGASSRHPFLEAVIENCVRAYDEPRWVDVMMEGTPALSRAEYFVLNTTGPGLVSRTLAESRGPAAAVTVLFPEDVCDTTQWNRFGGYGIHVMEGTWRPSSSYVRRRLAQRWEVWRMSRLIRQSRKLGPKRVHARANLPASVDSGISG
jgi:hypothetical protein